MAIIPPIPPAPNSSFYVQFFGPSVQCSAANSSQQSDFDYYSSALANGSVMTVTKDLFESGKLEWGAEGIPGNTAPLMNVYSAFSPYAGKLGWLRTDSPPFSAGDYFHDQFNNWIMDVPPESLKAWTLPSWNDTSESGFVLQQLWIQTAERSMVCTMGNASFEVWYRFMNGTQTFAAYNVSAFEPFWMPRYGGVLAQIEPVDLSTPWTATSWDPSNAYMAVYLAFSSLVNGNVSTTLTTLPTDQTDYAPAVPEAPEATAVTKLFAARAVLTNEFDGNARIHDGSSGVLENGLSACDEFVRGYWNGNNAIGIGEKGPVPWWQAANGTHYQVNGSESSWQLDSRRFTNITNSLFLKPAWMCRNRTLLRAVEDLANNVTISMLSSQGLTRQNTTIIDVLHSPTYIYNSSNLIMSYSIAVGFALLCVCLGFCALRYNGVVHSTDFSAIVATTRNHDLDSVSRGQPLGALPLKHTSMKVRFGELARGGEKALYHGSDGSGTGRHIGFGAAENVLSLKKGEKYV